MCVGVGVYVGVYVGVGVGVDVGVGVGGCGCGCEGLSGWMECVWKGGYYYFTISPSEQCYLDYIF